MHLWLVFKHVQAGTQYLPGMLGMIKIRYLHHTLPDFIALTNASSSITTMNQQSWRLDHVITTLPGPLDVLTINTPSCILENSLSDSRWVVSLVKGQCKVMSCDRASNSSKETYMAPPSSIIMSVQVDEKLA